jgi:hypothetical protein
MLLASRKIWRGDTPESKVSARSREQALLRAHQTKRLDAHLYGHDKLTEALFNSELPAAQGRAAKINDVESLIL